MLALEVNKVKVASAVWYVPCSVFIIYLPWQGKWKLLDLQKELTPSADLICGYLLLVSGDW